MEQHDELIQKARVFRSKIEEKLGDWLSKDMGSKMVDVNSCLMKVWERSIEFEHHLIEMHCCLTEETAKAWCDAMVNDDGTMGAHWTKEQTTAVAESLKIEFDNSHEHGGFSVVDFWAAMNMMYSDYYKVASQFSQNKPEFYAALAKVFLEDTDAPKPGKKLAKYYYYIAHGEH